MKLKFITNNFTAKFFSVIFASLLWFYIAQEQVQENIMQIKVNTIVLPGFSAASINPEYVTVKLSGPQNVLENLDEQAMAVEIDLRDYDNPTIINYALSSKDIPVPGNVNIDLIEPSQIKINLDKTISKNLPVQIIFTGMPQSGYKLASYTANPSMATFKGPAQLLKDINNVSTLPVDLTGRTESFVQTISLVPLLAADHQHHEKLIDVYVNIDETPGTRVFNNVPVRVLSASERNRKISLLPEKVTVELEGKSVDLNAVNIKNMVVFVETDQLKDGSYTLPVKSWIQDKAEVIKITPSEIEVTIE